jgi:hypothetical protein
VERTEEPEPPSRSAAESIPEPPRAAVRGGGRRKRRGKTGPRRPGVVDLPRASWKPELLRKDADAVNPVDREHRLAVPRHQAAAFLRP